MAEANPSTLKVQYNVTHGIDQGGKIIAEYVWIDGSGVVLRGKARTLNKKVTCVADIPEWNFDGSSCYMAPTENSEVILKPVAYYRDPFRQGDNILVMCETYVWEDTTYKKLVPANTNFRAYATKIWDACPEEVPWYGIEQEYQLLVGHGRFTTWPLGWPKDGYPGPQGPYYCSIGASNTFGRIIADNHYKCCLYAGINISGTNAEVAPGQWEYQIGPSVGVDVGDMMHMSRYLLTRCAEDYGVDVSFAPKLFPDWNGSGCHTNYSTETMRAGTGGMEYIHDMMKKFEAKHAQHISVYGEDNHLRLTGHHETSSSTKFSFGVGNRAASFRIPTATTAANGKGYIEDRRPASNIDAYLVASMIFDTSVLKESLASPMLAHFEKWQKFAKETDIPKAL